MLRAFAAGTFAALTAPAIGTFLVVRRYSQLSDTLAHASLLGVAIALLTGLAPQPVALVVALLAALGIEWLGSRTQLYGESILALFLSGSLGLAAIIISLAQGFDTNLFAYLFGSITTVTPSEVWLITILSCCVLTTLWLAYRPLFLIALDSDLARASGLPVARYNFLLVALAAITIGLALRIVGALLIGALMVIPVIAALQLRRSFVSTIFWSMGLGLIATLVGLTAAYYLDLAPGGSIVVILIILFLGIRLIRR